MVNVFGNDIISAYTNGVNVKEIYSFGNKVWPSSSIKPVKCIYQSITSTTTWTDCPQLRIPLVDSSISRFCIEIDIKPNARNKEYIFGYGKMGNFDTNVCYIRKYSNTPYELVYGIIGSLDSSTISDFSRGVLKCEWKVSNRWNIIWKSLQATTTLNSTNNVILTFLKSNHGSTGPGYIVSLSKIYGVVIKDQNSNVIMNLIPALNEDTGLAGLYDTVNNTFYGNSSSSGTILYESL